jgi:hypothetical protein
VVASQHFLSHASSVGWFILISLREIRRPLKNNCSETVAANASVSLRVGKVMRIHGEVVKAFYAVLDEVMIFY